MNPSTFFVAALVVVVVVAIIANEIRKKKLGIGSCSCGGNCGACGGCGGNDAAADEK